MVNIRKIKRNLNPLITGVSTIFEYCPFGMIMPGRKYTKSGGDYRFGFNGQEKNSDLSGTDGGHYDFMFRIHDARLGRFLSVDPLSASYPWNSSYAFAENRVIDGVDLEGQEFNWFMAELTEELFFGTTRLKQIRAGALEHSIEIVMGTVQAVPVAIELAQYHQKLLSDKSNYTLGTAHDQEQLAKGRAATEFLMALTYEVVQKTIQNYAVLMEKAAAGDEAAIGALFVEIVLLASELDELRHLRGLKGIGNKLKSSKSLLTPDEMRLIRGGEAPTFYRGGDNFDLRKGIDYKVNPDGYVNNRGISINTNKFDKNIQKYGGAYEIDLNSIPEGLKIQHTGGSHYEIIPSKKMMEGEFLELMDQLRVKPVNKVD